jgi:DNA-directed RNA polymerase subunit RPC12/RpoP
MMRGAFDCCNGVLARSLREHRAEHREQHSKSSSTTQVPCEECASRLLYHRRSDERISKFSECSPDTDDRDEYERNRCPTNAACEQKSDRSKEYGGEPDGGNEVASLSETSSRTAKHNAVIT